MTVAAKISGEIIWHRNATHIYKYQLLPMISITILFVFEDRSEAHKKCRLIGGTLVPRTGVEPVQG